MAPERLVNPKAKDEDKTIDLTLRPTTFNEYVGQDKIKDSLNIFIQAAEKRQEAMEHILIHGGPGLGKTTLAHIIAREKNANIRVTSGPAVERAGDLAAILTNLQDGDIIFVDEIHRLNKTIEEVLYPAMEDYCLDLVVGKGPTAKTLRLDLPKFTIIGATTKINLISSPLRDRFGMVCRLEYYNNEDIQKIIERSAKILSIELENEVGKKIASRSRWTPRIANRLLKRVRDFSQVKGDGVVTQDLVDQALATLEIDKLGLDQVDRKILQTIVEKFNGGPVGLNTIAAITAEDMSTVEEVYEPFLLQIGFLARTPRGRVVTEGACRHLGIKIPQGLQIKLM